MAVNLTLLAIDGSPYHNSIIDSGTTALIDENIADHVKIAELTGFDPARIPPSGSYKIVVVEDYGGRFEVIQENGKWYLVGIGGSANFDYEDPDYAGEFPGITFQFRDSNDTNNSGTVYQQLAIGVRLNDVEPETVALPAISIDDVVVTEGNGGTASPTLMTFTVTRSGDTSGASSVDWALAHGTTSAGDFVVDGTHPLSGTVNFGAGETSKTIVLQVNGDTSFEPNETFSINLSNVTNATISDGAGAGTINNDDVAPTPVVQFDSASLAITQAEGNSGATAYLFTITRSGADLSGASTVNWAVTGIGVNPANGADFGGTLPAGSVTFAAGEISKTITVNVSGDTAFESAEQFLVTLSAGTNSTINANNVATGTITNDDAAPPPPALSINDMTVTEGNGGAGSPTLMTFTVTRSGDTSGASSVDWALAHGNTTAGDFVVDGTHPLSGTVNFGAGETSKTIVLQVNGDTAFEPTETFSINLSNASNATISDATGAGTINNDDVAPTPVVQFSSPAPSVTQAEGNSGTVTFTYFVMRDTTSGDSTVNWAVTGSGANPADGADFGGTLPGGQVTFLNGENVKSFTVSVSGDTVFEQAEQFTVTLSAGTNSTINANNVATGTITNDDAAPPPPALSINGMTVTEGNGGAGSPTLMTFTVTRSGDTSGASSVDWALAHGNTTAGDFVVDGTHPLSGTVNFGAGETSKTIVLQVNGDTSFEPNETFSVNLSNASNATILNAFGSGTITNDDVAPPPPALSINDMTVTEGNGGAGSPTLMTFTVTRSGDTSGASSVDWALAHGNTTASDFVVDGTHPLSGTVNFGAGETSKTIVLQVNGDTAFEPTETFSINLSNASNSTISDATGAGTINNDDVASTPVVQFSSPAPTVSHTEANSGTVTYTYFVIRDTTVGSSTVNWAVTGSGANPADGADFGGALPSGQVTFADGENVKQFDVTVSGDTVVEATEQFTVTLSAGTNSTINANNVATGTITNDDAAPPPPALSINDMTVTEGNGGAASPTLMTFTVTRSGDTSGASSVDWALAHGNTTAGDFVVDGTHPLSGTVSFAAGETSKTIELQVNGDTAFEPTETFSINLSNASNATISDATGAGTINNDDVAPPAPVFSIAATDAVKAEGDSGYTEFTFTITRSGDTSAASSINWQAQGTGGNPTSGGDFIVGWTSGTESFAVGETSKTITVRVAGDTTIEPNETYSVVLSAPNNGTVSTTAGSADGTILDDDEHAPTFMVDSSQNYFSGSTGAAISGVFAGIDMNDLDGDQLTLTLSFLDANGALSGMATGGNVTVTDDNTNPQSGIHQYTLVGSAADLEAFLAQRSFTPAAPGQNTKFSFTLTDLHHAPAAYGDQITVLGEFPGNHAPVPATASVVVHEGKPANFEIASFAAVDLEGTVVDYQFWGAQANSGGKISGDGRFQIVGNKIVALDLSVGTDTQATYVVTASDGTYTVNGNVTITIKNNQAPTIGSVAAAGGGRAGNAGTILVNDTVGAVQIAAVAASDPDAAQDGRTLTYALADTYNGLFAIDPDGKVRIADASKLPVSADTPYQLTIQVSDGSDTTTQAVTVTVVNVPALNHAPGDLKLNVTHAPNEYEASGTVVGALSASDSDGDALSYALLDSAGGRFKLVGNQLVVDNGFLFDYEQATSHKVTVQVADGHGGVATEIFTIGVGNIDPEVTGGTVGNDVFYGGIGKDKLFGGAGNDRLFGGLNADIVKGLTGNDTVGGGAGKDKLFGGKGKFSKDMFVFDTKLTSAKVAKKNVDKIYDFGPKYDSVGFDDLAFSNRTIAKYVKKKGGATLDHALKIDKHWFRVGDKALDRNDFFIYNDKTHKLYFDVDGSGHKAMVEVASFAAFEKKAGLTLTFKDFFLI